MVAVYQTHQLVHTLCEELVITLVARADANTGQLGGAADRMRPFIAELSRLVAEP
jgi:hypothetical protein